MITRNLIKLYEVKPGDVIRVPGRNGSIGRPEGLEVANIKEEAYKSQLRISFKGGLQMNENRETQVEVISSKTNDKRMVLKDGSEVRAEAPITSQAVMVLTFMKDEDGQPFADVSSHGEGPAKEVMDTIVAEFGNAYKNMVRKGK